MPPLNIEPLIAAAVLLATAATTPSTPSMCCSPTPWSGAAAFPPPIWSSIWYLLSSFAVISYTQHWGYVIFAALGSFIGAYLIMTFLHPKPTYPPPPVGSAPS